MLSRNATKFVNSLKIKKYRQEHQAFIVEGEKSVSELLKGGLDIITLYAVGEWLNDNASALRNTNCSIETVTEQELGRISDLTTPNKVLAVVRMPDTEKLPAPDFSDLILALDSIRDPGNMGTIIRTADWFGIRTIICSPDCVDLYNPKVIQATMGSFNRIRVMYHELGDFLKNAPKGIPVYGALLQGQRISSIKFRKNGILVIGNESRGIAKELIPLISDPVYIPPYVAEGAGTYRAESLNASIANAIICYEIRKQLPENKF